MYKNTVNLISKYRSQLMGFSMIWIILYHYFGKNTSVTLSNLILQIGHGGVDIFLFLSGFGLLFGMYKSKKNQVSNIGFIKKRIIRIIPVYYTVIIFSGILLSKTVFRVLQELLVFGFFIPIGITPSYDWFIPSIMLLYFIFPFYYGIFIKKPYRSTLYAILVGLLLTFALIYIQKGTIILFFSRIPIFFTGVFFGYLYLIKEELKPNQRTIILLLGAISLIVELILAYNYSGIYLRKTGLAHLPFLFIVPFLIMLLSSLFEQISSMPYINKLNQVFSFFGQYSLEIYLIHMSLGMFPFVQSIILNLILAVILKKGIELLMPYINKLLMVKS